jgi:3-methyladenine DNA glycosylase Tag
MLETKLDSPFAHTEKTTHSYQTVNKIISLTLKKCPDAAQMIRCYTDIDIKKLTNNQILAEVCWIIYCSGFKFDVIQKYWPKISNALRSFDVVQVASLSIDIETTANEICSKSGFKNKRKALWCINNAQRIMDLDEEFSKYGGLKGYFLELSRFDTLSIVKMTPNILQELKFKGIGNVTIFHLLKNIGLDVFKPDLHVCRLLERVGLISQKATILEIYSVMSNLAKANDLKVKELDSLLFMYGKMTSDQIPIH